MSEKLLVPDIGDFENVEVIELLVKEGEETVSYTHLTLPTSDLV